MPRHLLIVEHDPDAPAGLLAQWAAGRDLLMRTVRLHAGEALPDTVPASRGASEAGPGTVAAVLGSEQTAYDDSVPWLAGELSFVTRLLAAQVPVLGICFGAQVLARVLGARLFRLSEPEIGWVWAASRSPHLADGPWPSWHRDAFTLPAGARELAANQVGVQAFSYGPHAGVQFHPEATQQIVASWLAGSSPPPGTSLTEPLFSPDAGPMWQQAAANAQTLFSAWFDGKLSGG